VEVFIKAQLARFPNMPPILASVYGVYEIKRPDIRGVKSSASKTKKKGVRCAKTTATEYILFD